MSPLRKKQSASWAARIGAALLAAWTLAACSSVALGGEWQWVAGEGWAQTTNPPKATAKEQNAYAFSFEKKREYMNAAAQYYLVIQHFPNDEAQVGVALQRLALCLHVMENYFKAYQALEQLIKDYPNTIKRGELLQIELLIGKKIMEMDTPSLIGSGSKEEQYRQSAMVFASVAAHDPWGATAPEALVMRGDVLMLLHDYKGAREAYRRVLTEFSNFDEQVARANLGNTRLDALEGVGGTTLADVKAQREETERILRRNEEESKLYTFVEKDLQVQDLEIQEAAAKKMMTQANTYWKIGTREARDSCVFLLGDINQRYPNTKTAADARARLAEIKLPRKKNQLDVLRNQFAPSTILASTLNKDKPPAIVIPQLPADAQIDPSEAGVPPVLTADYAALTEIAAPMRPHGLDTLTANASTDPRPDTPSFAMDGGALAMGSAPSSRPGPGDEFVGPRRWDAPTTSGTPYSGHPAPTAATANIATTPGGAGATSIPGLPPLGVTGTTALPVTTSHPSTGPMTPMPMRSTSPSPSMGHPSATTMTGYGADTRLVSASLTDGGATLEPATMRTAPVNTRRMRMERAFIRPDPVDGETSTPTSTPPAPSMSSSTSLMPTSDSPMPTATSPAPRLDASSTASTMPPAPGRPRLSTPSFPSTGGEGALPPPGVGATTSLDASFPPLPETPAVLPSGLAPLPSTPSPAAPSMPAGLDVGLPPSPSGLFGTNFQ